MSGVIPPIFASSIILFPGNAGELVYDGRRDPLDPRSGSGTVAGDSRCTSCCTPA